MTDPTPAGADKPLFEMVPTSAAYLELVTQVAELTDDVTHLLAHVPALDNDDDEDDEEAGHVLDTAAQFETLGYRLDRHRAEIENVKRVLNQIIRFLGSTGIPTTPPADGDTVTADTGAS